MKDSLECEDLSLPPKPEFYPDEAEVTVPEAALRLRLEMLEADMVVLKQTMMDGLEALESILNDLQNTRDNTDLY